MGCACTVPVGQEMGAVTTGSLRENNRVRITAASPPPSSLLSSISLSLSSSPRTPLHTPPSASLSAHSRRAVVSPGPLVHCYKTDERRSVRNCVCISVRVLGTKAVLVAGWFVCLCWVCFRIGECRPCFQLKGKNKDIHVSLYTATVSRSHLKRQVF